MKKILFLMLLVLHSALCAGETPPSFEEKIILPIGLGVMPDKNYNDYQFIDGNGAPFWNNETRVLSDSTQRIILYNHHTLTISAYARFELKKPLWSLSLPRWGYHHGMGCTREPENIYEILTLMGHIEKDEKSDTYFYRKTKRKFKILGPDGENIRPPTMVQPIPKECMNQGVEIFFVEGGGTDGIVLRERRTRNLLIVNMDGEIIPYGNIKLEDPAQEYGGVIKQALM